MSQERGEMFDPHVESALAELQGMIAQHHPTATFEISRGEDEPENIHLTAVVDVDDTDDVLGLVIDRLVTLQVDERIPVHVIPIRTPERVLAAMRAQPTPRRLRLGRTINPTREREVIGG